LRVFLVASMLLLLAWTALRLSLAVDGTAADPSPGDAPSSPAAPVEGPPVPDVLASVLPDAPPEAVEHIDSMPFKLPTTAKAERDERRRRRRRRGLQAQLRLYRDAGGRICEKADIAFPGSRIFTAEITASHDDETGKSTVTILLRNVHDDEYRSVIAIELHGTVPPAIDATNATFEMVRRFPNHPQLEPREGRIGIRLQAHPLPHGRSPETVHLRAPLTTRVIAAREWEPDRIPASLHATVAVDEDAPDGLLVGAYCASYDGDWYQGPAVALAPGIHDLRFPIGPGSDMVSEPHAQRWSGAAALRSWECGLYLASTAESNASIGIERLELVSDPSRLPSTGFRLLDLDPDPTHLRTGERWEVRFRPDPMPDRPYVAEHFACDLVVDGPQGERRYPAFYARPLRLVDRGDIEVGVPDGPARFVARWRPQFAGTFRLRLETRHGDEETRSFDLPDLLVDGEPWDEYVRVDGDDPRFFSVGRRAGEERFIWPIGLNLRSVNDTRSRSRLKTDLTPDRGMHAYRAYLDRLAAAGGDLTEVWMSSWNLALEWNRLWPGYDGLYQYNQVNAARLDALLDHAWERGIRVILVLNNHGQLSRRSDREWTYNPWYSWNGGPLEEPADFFRDPAALAAQRNLKRYLIARWADHPALFAWKLCSEIQLTAMPREERVPWHEYGADYLHEHDHYGHPVTTHWAGDYRAPFPEVCRMPEIDFVAIDAYHRDRTLLAELLWKSTQDPERGLARFGKPLVTTEFGGSSGATSDARMLCEHLTGYHASFVAGHATGPLLWWFEWVDQEDRWMPYASIRRFVEGEDLRGEDSRPLEVRVRERVDGEIWAGAWRQPGRAFAYVVDAEWGTEGGEARVVEGCELRFPDPLPGGTWRVEWWDPDTGTIVGRERIEERGRLARLPLPPFRRHLALKLIRPQR